MLGQRIKDLRTEKGLSRKELSEMLNVSLSAVGLWETNQRTPNTEILLKLSSIFSVSIDELLRESTQDQQEKNIVSILGSNGITKKYYLDNTAIRSLESIIDLISKKENHKFD